LGVFVTLYCLVDELGISRARPNLYFLQNLITREAAMLLVIQSRIERYCIIGLSMSWWLCLLKVCILNYRGLLVLSRLLKNDDLDVRSTVGESIALLYEMTYLAPSTEEVAEDSANDKVLVARATIPEE
jgi:hypothetical protein